MIRKTSETRALAGNITSAYNNSQTSAYSTEYINDLNEWKLVDTVTGTTGITLPETYNEICIVSTSGSNVSHTIIPVLMLTDSYLYYAGSGYYNGSSDKVICTWRARKTNLALNIFVLNANTVTSTATTSVYYK